MLLLLLFGMALAWFLQKKLYQKNWQKNLKIQVSFQDSAIYEGEESTLKEVVVNDKLLPIPALELGISMSRNLEFDREAKANASITDQSYKRDVFSFLFHQQVTRTLPFQAKKRGFYEITGAQNQVLWVIPYLPGEEVPSEQNRAYTAIGWEVKPWK